MGTIVFALVIVWFLIFQDQIEKFLGFYKKNSNFFLIFSFILFLVLALIAYIQKPKIYVLIYEIVVFSLCVTQIFLLKNYISNIQPVEKIGLGEKIIGFFSILIFLAINFGFLNIFFLLKNFRKILGL